MVINWTEQSTNVRKGTTTTNTKVCLNIFMHNVMFSTGGKKKLEKEFGNDGQN